MKVRERFDQELKKLENLLTELSDFAISALSKSMTALEQKDIDLALQIIEKDKKANALYEEIHDFSILLIAKQQPVATDLRKIIMTLKIATNLERIADFAVNIAKSTTRIGKDAKLLERPLENIKRMYQISEIMFNTGIQAFIDVDLKQAKKIAEMDHEVDRLYGETILKLFALNKSNPEKIDQIIQFLLICRYLERTADHVTNIAENVIYLEKGKHYDLND